MKRVIEAAHRPVCAVDRRRAVAAVARLMAAEQVGAVVVVEYDGRPVGIVTDRDLVLRALAVGLDPEAPVEQVMTSDPITVEADDSVDSVYGVLRQHGIRQVPVTADGGLVGMVGLDDLVIELTAQLGNLLPPRPETVTT